MDAKDIALIKALGGGGCSSASGQLIVTVYNTNLQGTTYAADKTYDEISAAIDSGMSVVLNYKFSITSSYYSVYYLFSTEDGFYQFCNFEVVAGEIYLCCINIYEENGEMVIARTKDRLQIAT